MARTRVSGALHVCSFTSLEHLKQKDERDPAAVLAALRKVTRVSNFDITRTQALAVTFQRLVDSGQIKVTPETFPWSKVEVMGE